MAWDAKPPPRSQLLHAAGMIPGPVVHFNIGASYYFAKFRLPPARFLLNHRPETGQGCGNKPTAGPQSLRADRAGRTLPPIANPVPRGAGQRGKGRRKHAANLREGEAWDGN